jgi:predicted flavoprotein YhiN
VVIATGGLSIPKIGATDFGYRIAAQFGLRMVEPRPALVPLTFDAEQWAPFVEMAGIALEVDVETGSPKAATRPARASAKTCCSPTAACPARRSCRFRRTGSRARPSPSTCCRNWTWRTLIEGKGTIKKQLGNVLAQWLPARLAEGLLLAHGFALDARLPTCRMRSCASWAPPSTSGR